MKRKIIGIFILTMLIVTTIPIVNSADKNVSSQISNEGYVVDECGCGSNSGSGIGIMKKSIPHNPNYIAPIQTILGLPDYFNWKDFGGQDWTTPAKDQAYPKYCGCCWAHAAIGALESVINIRETSAIIDPDLSEQYILSCLPDAAYTPGEGCSSGGESIFAFELMIAETREGNYHNGALLEECFPYQADDNISCSDKCPEWVDKLVPILNTSEWYPSGRPKDTRLIKSQIIEIGPVATAMMSTTDFRNWEETHHDPDDYYPYYKGSHHNHQVIIVGWKDDPSISKGGYWICKDSHGNEVGYDGFFNIEYESLLIDRYINWVDYDPESYEWSNEPDPPGKTTITGVMNGNISTEYEYTFNSVDPEVRDVKYYISWGDGDWEWTDYYPSGENVFVTHSWDKKGDYSVVALAMNTDNSISSWSTLEVAMPKNKAINTPYLQFLENHPRLFPLLRQLFGL